MLLAQIMIPAGCAVAILYSIWLAYDVLRRDKGTPEMQEVAGTILEGANAFLSRQYRTIAMLAVVTAVVVGVIVGVFKGNADTGVLTGVSFIVGAFASGLSGYIGMSIAVRANGRTASAAQNSLADAINTALRGGACSGFLVVALSLMGVAGIFGVFSRILGHPVDETPFLIVGFGFGASFVALFAQLGGGIYTKAADVGADLVGKVEAGIPEDDPRNAAVIADLVGDNVGDCAGRGADLFESMSAENIGAMILGVAIFTATGKVEWILFPLVLRSFGVFAAMLGMFTVPFWAKRIKRPDGRTQRRLLGHHGCSASDCLALATYEMLGSAWYWFFFCGLVGIIDRHRVRLHHPVLHRRRLATGAGNRSGEPHRRGHEHHYRYGRRLRNDGCHRHHRRHRAGDIVRAGPARQPRQRQRHLDRRVRHRRRDHGHAHVGRLRARDGHLRADHRQRWRHHRDG